MNDILGKAKNKLKDEVKSLALTLSKIDTFSGLIALEPKLNQIKERLAVFKYLENSSTSIPLSQENLFKEESESYFLSYLKTAADIIDTISKSGIKKSAHRPIWINMNDKIAFVKELFAGDAIAFKQMMTDFNQSDSLETTDRHVKMDLQVVPT